ncbi:alpha/beta hydrolase [Listeria monocytogenes]|nr:alpha/beta hydrolase [Listeria monocytogenes]
MEYHDCLINLKENDKDDGNWIIKQVPEGVKGLEPRTLTRIQKDIQTGRPKLFDENAANLTATVLRARFGNYPANYVPKQAILEQYETLNGKKIKRYIPENAKDATILFFHGGGFFAGSIEAMDKPCLALADYSGMEVVSIDYELAPENPFPSGLLTCYQAVCSIFKEKGGPVFVAGDSAGGALAISASLLDKELGTNIIKGILTVYPTVKRELEKKEFYSRIQEYTIPLEQQETIMGQFNAFLETNIQVTDWYIQHGVKANNPFVSPLFANLKNLPPIFMASAEFDTLRLEEEDFVMNLKKAGVPFKAYRYDGMVHGFMDKLGLFPQAEDVIYEMGYFLKQLNK